MSLPPPIFNHDTVSSQVQEYLRRLSESHNNLEARVALLSTHPSLATAEPPQPQVIIEQIPQVMGLGQLQQGQFTYAPVVLALPPIGDPLRQNGQIVFLSTGGNIVEYVFDGTTDPGTWKTTGMGGTVTSVAMTVPLRLVVTGSPIIGAGTLAVAENVHTWDKTVDADATPVTANANVTTDQTLMTFAFGTGELDTLAKAVHVYAAGVYTTQAGQTPTIRFRLFMDAVQILNWQCNATTASATDMNWELSVWFIITTTGAAGNVEAHGNAIVALGTVGGMLAETYLDTINTVSGGFGVNGAPVLAVKARFSTQPGAAPRNSITQRALIVTQLN